MKKLIMILMFCLCGFLFAEEFTIGNDLAITLEENHRRDNFFVGKITAILPYENGCILKVSDKDYTFEYFIQKGFEFYTFVRTRDENINPIFVFKKITVKTILPNVIEFESEEYDRQPLF